MKQPTSGTLVRNPPPHEFAPEMDPVVARVARLARDMFVDPAHQRNAEIQRRRLARQTIDLRRKYAVRGWLGGRWWRSCEDCHCGRGHKIVVIQSRVPQSSSGLGYELEEHCPSTLWGRLRLARPDLYIPASYFLCPTDGWEDVMEGALMNMPKGLSLNEEELYRRRQAARVEDVLAALEKIDRELADSVRGLKKTDLQKKLTRYRALLHGDLADEI